VDEQVFAFQQFHDDERVAFVLFNLMDDGKRPNFPSGERSPAQVSMGA
jgi:hypothetical protein